MSVDTSSSINLEQGARMKWEGVDKNPGSQVHHLWRSKLPTGWLVRDHSGSICHVLDPEHEWKLDGEVTEEKVESGMKPCDNCTKSNPSDANFCNSCGNQFGDAVKICPNCEIEYPLSERFCPRDGTALRSPIIPTTIRMQMADPSMVTRRR